MLIGSDSHSLNIFFFMISSRYNLIHVFLNFICAKKKNLSESIISMHVFHLEKKKIVHDEDSHTIRLFIA